MNINIILVITVLVSIGIIDVVKTEKRLRFTVKNVTTWSDNKLCNFTYAIDEKIPSADFMMNILTPINNMEFYMYGSAVVKSNSRHYGSFNTTFNICQLLAIKNSSPIATLVYAHLKNYGHLIESCPIKKDSYYMNKIWPNDHSAQLKIPEIEFNVNIKAYSVENENPILIMDNYIIAEAVYMEIAGDMKKTGLLSLLGSGR